MTVNTLDTRPTPCTQNADLFQHPLVEDDQPARTAADRRQQAALVARAQQLCSECPMMAQCLVQAVVEHNVSGVVAGTTPRQRSAIRAELGVRVADEDLDSLAGVGSGPIDAHDLLRQRLANPGESLEQLAKRTGCSLSTVKRHLRKARTEAPATHRLRAVRPSLEQVMHAHQVVTNRGQRRVEVTRAA